NKRLEVDRTMADHDAKALFKAGEKRHGTDEKIFRVIFSGK
nr:annexin D5-like [Tanacetum cinerariifolium]